MRKGKVFVESMFAGVICETASGFTFQYDADYLLRKDALPVSITFPLQEGEFTSKTLFSFF